MDDAPDSPDSEREALPVRSGTLRGRAPELSSFDRLITQVIEGRSAVVFLGGAAGHGKSRLLAEVDIRARRAGVRFATAAAEPTDEDSAYATLLSALTAGPDPVLVGDALMKLRASRGDRYWFLMDLASALEESSLERPLIIALDDLQWADSASLEAVRILSTRLSSTSVAWILAFRPNHALPALTRLVSEADEVVSTTVTLAPLDEEAVTEVIHDHFVEPPAALVRAAKLAEGVPFFLLELIRSSSESGTGTSELVSTGSDDSALPVRAAAGIARRIDALGPEAWKAAQVGAVLGRSFRSDDIATLLGSSVMGAVDTLDTLVRADVVVPDASHWRFRHDIVRQAVLDTIAAPTRAAMERAAAEVLIAAGIAPEDVARRVAANAKRGDEKALRTLTVASQSLLATEPGTASDLLKVAMTLVEPGDPRRVMLGLSAVVGLHLASRSGEALRLAEEIASDVVDSEQRAQLQLSLATMYSLPGDVRVEHGRRGLAAEGVSAALRARHLGVLVLSSTAQGDLSAAEELAEEAAVLVAATGDDTARLHLAFGAMTLDEATYRYGAALDRLPQIRALGAQVGDQAPALGAEWLRANVLVSLDRFSQAWDVATAGMITARENHQAWIATRWEFWQGWYLLQTGHLSDARAVLEGAILADGLEVATALPDAVGVAALGRLARHLGDDRLRRRCVRIATSTLALGMGDDARRHLGWYLVMDAVAEDDLESARARLRELRAGPVPMPVLAVDVGAETQFLRAAQVVGDQESALTFSEAATRRAESNPGVESLRAAAAHARGLLLADTELLADAARSFDRQQRPLLAMSANEDLGAALTRQGRTEDAIEPLTTALGIAMTVGASFDAQRLRWRLRSLGVQRRITTSTRPKDGWEALTPAELAVAQHVGAGASNRVAAERLFLSPHTVSAHLRRVFEKLAISSRHDLARILAERAQTD